MNTQSTSPTKPAITPVRKKETMSFFDALKETLDGKKIHKLEWEDKEYYGYLKNAKLFLHKPAGDAEKSRAGTDHSWTISEGDLIGEDWVVL